MKIHTLIYLPWPRAEWQAVKDDESFFLYPVFRSTLFFLSLALRLCFVLMSCSRHGGIYILSPQHGYIQLTHETRVGWWREQIPTNINQLIIIHSNSFGRFYLLKPHTLRTRRRLTLDNMMGRTYECRLQMSAHMHYQPSQRSENVSMRILQHKSSLKSWLVVYLIRIRHE